jgi:hypothetical protein
MYFVYSAVFTLLAAFYASIDFVKHNFIYFIRVWSACYEKFSLTFISTDFANGIILYLPQFRSERTPVREDCCLLFFRLS